MASDPLTRATASLYGLALGDALGSQFFVPANREALTTRTLPPGPWQWTDDTEMACSVYRLLADRGLVDQDALAASFAAHHDFDRGYGPATGRMLRLVREGGDWRALASGLFDGNGSWGNGAAMRVAPLGAWFAGDPAAAVRQADLSARVTHTHPEAVAGAVAVAVAAAVATSEADLSPGRFLDAVLDHTPPGSVRDGIGAARRLLTVADPLLAARALGNGRKTAAHDTVPFTLWSAARHLDDVEQAIWTTATAGGDVDTTSAIVGGILGGRAGLGGLPRAWLRRAEPLPGWAEVPAGLRPETADGAWLHSTAGVTVPSAPGGTVTRSSLRKVVPFAAPVAMPPPERVWSDDDWAVIRLGHRPVGMDDRWSAYVEGDTLHLHRSWTGHQIYEARFGRTQGGRFVVAARVEADRGRHRRVGDAYDRLLLELLVDTILLQRHDPRRWDELASLR
ncbi:ADP-ribosylglycohydrolase family protein [Microbispora rosea]